MYRISDRWSVDGGYFGMGRNSTTSTSHTISWGPITFPLTTEVSADFEASVYRLAARYAFYRSSNAEFGAAISLYGTDLKAALAGSITLGPKLVVFPSRPRRNFRAAARGRVFRSLCPLSQMAYHWARRFYRSDHWRDLCFRLRYERRRRTHPHRRRRVGISRPGKFGSGGELPLHGRYNGSHDHWPEGGAFVYVLRTHCVRSGELLTKIQAGSIPLPLRKPLLK